MSALVCESKPTPGKHLANTISKTEKRRLSPTSNFTVDVDQDTENMQRRTRKVVMTMALKNRSPLEWLQVKSKLPLYLFTLNPLLGVVTACIIPLIPESCIV